MLPPSRRKSDCLNLIPLLILLFLTTSASAVSAVLGIDFGTEYIKAAIAKPGSPIEIVLTKDSKRKEAAALAFKPSRAQTNDPDAFPERLYGGDALALSARFPSDVFINLKTVLGLPTSSQQVQDYLARFPGLQEHAYARDGASTLGFASQSLGKGATFMVEELLAMEFKNIKANAQAVVGKDNHISDVVITVPAYFSPEEKSAVELAANLAGLRVLGLISDGLAVGLNYATHRKFESISEGGKHEYHVIYDMGAGSTTATVLKFQGRTIKGPGKKNQTIQEVQVLGIGSDRTLGGDSLNDLIVNDMIEKFLASPPMQPHNVPSIEVKKHDKTMARLWKDAEKVRQVLSANSVAHTSLEGLYLHDVTFKYKLTRENFELLAKEHAARIARPLNDALLMANIRLEEVESVILHGGLIRTPFIQKRLEEVAGGASKLKTNVNADEAAVMGAAFRAASISPAYRVKDIRGTEVSGTAYIVSWTDEKIREQKIFVPTSQVGVEKQLQVKAQEDTSVLFITDELETAHQVVAIHLTNLTKSVNELKDKYHCTAANITTLFNLRLSVVNGFPEFASGSVSCKPQKVKDSVMDNVKGLFGLGKKDQEPLTEADESDDLSASKPLPVQDETSSGTTVTPSAAAESSASSSSSSASSASAKIKAKPTPKVVTIPLATKVDVTGLNAPPHEELPSIRKRLDQFDASDKNSVLRAEALNVLEAFTYRARDYLEDQAFMTASTEEIRKQLSQQLSTVSEWLYGDGVDAKLEDFKAKLKTLKDIVDPVLKRKDESGKRKDAIESVEKELKMAQSYMEMIKASLEKAAEAALSSASSAASSVSEQVSSVVASPSEGAELEEDPYSTSSSVAAAETEPILPKMYEYTADDLSSLTKAYDSVKQWLDEKTALQEKLGPHEDPALWVDDLVGKGAEVQQAVTNLVLKQISFKPPKPKKSKTSKKSKTKKTKTVETEPSATESATSTSTVSGKDEL